MQGRTVVVTGAFGALGRVVVRAAAAAGANVAAIDFAAEAPAALGAGETVLAIGGVDLTDPAQAQAALARAAEAFGRVDALVNIAGGFVWETVADGSPDSWDRMHALNVRTCLNASRAALPHLQARGAGRIVNVGANGAVKAAMGMGAYAASKAGVHRLTEALAEELKGQGITVNAVLPSIIDTPANRAEMGESEAHKWVRPEDLAAVILFLASDAARAVTGALVPVTGEV